MASTNKTPNLELPQWTAADKMERVDLNTAFEKVDTAHAAHLADYASLLEGGEIFEAVLQNGFTQTLSYRKNDIGIVHLWGEVRGEVTGTGTTTIATLPEGFRPKVALNLSVLRYGTGFPLERAYLTPSGTLNVSGDPWPLAGHIINVLYQV